MTRRPNLSCPENRRALLACALAFAAGAFTPALHAQTDCTGQINCMPLQVPPFPNSYAPTSCAPDLGDPAGSDWVLPYGTTWVNCAWTPDRRPFAYVQFFNPDADAHVPGLGNPQGLQLWWHPEGTRDYILDQDRNGVPDQFEKLLEELDTLYAEGFRRFVLQLPAGAPFGRMKPADPSGVNQLMGVQVFSMNQWNAMADFKKNWFSDPNGAWRQWVDARQNTTDPFEKIKIEIYMGSSVADGTCTQCISPNDFQTMTSASVPVEYAPNGFIQYASRWVSPCVGVGRAVDFDPRVPDHVEYVLETILPWRAAGVTGFWLDAASRNANRDGDRRRWGATELAYMPGLRAAGVSVGMESLPVYNSNERPDWCTIYKMPCVTTQPQAMGPVSGGERRFRDAWWFDRARTEVHYLHFDPALDFDNAGEARRRGMILTLYRMSNLSDYEVIKRWYSMGRIWIADYNADGRCTYDDLIEFEEAFFNAPFDPRVFATGDVNGDGKRSSADRDLMLDAVYNQLGRYTHQASPAYIRDYGRPNDM